MKNNELRIMTVQGEREKGPSNGLAVSDISTFLNLLADPSILIYI